MPLATIPAPAPATDPASPVAARPVAPVATKPGAPTTGPATFAEGLIQVIAQVSAEPATTAAAGTPPPPTVATVASTPAPQATAPPAPLAAGPATILPPRDPGTSMHPVAGRRLARPKQRDDGTPATPAIVASAPASGPVMAAATPLLATPLLTTPALAPRHAPPAVPTPASGNGVRHLAPVVGGDSVPPHADHTAMVGTPATAPGVAHDKVASFNAALTAPVAPGAAVPSPPSLLTASVSAPAMSVSSAPTGTAGAMAPPVPLPVPDGVPQFPITIRAPSHYAVSLTSAAGPVHVAMAFAGSGDVRATVSTPAPHLFALLRAEQPALTHHLAQSGIQLADGGLTLSLGQHGGAPAGQGGGGRGGRRPALSRGRAIAAVTLAPASVMPAARLDLHA